ncbi:uncharacterized protein LOC110093485 [Dendrobium catenatum]|uniref:uncharacterized protein LOC110093485 n=1 Tax=Dendrobium catenatum TaxID=906689 RepID=UPI0009F3EDF3|nr:uncharacterized protein LOC110093485 [Dendrobium catenatum]
MKEDAELVNAERLKNSLVIKVFGKEIPAHVVAWEVRRQWKLFGNFHFTTLGKGWFLCSFETKYMMEGVLSGGPWFVNSHIIGMEKWTVEFSTLSLKGLTSPIWVRIPFSAGMKSMWLGLLQQLILPLGVWVETISRSIFQKFEYEKISTFCYECGLIGHIKADCENKKKDIMEKVAEHGKKGEATVTEDVFGMEDESTYGP